MKTVLLICALPIVFYGVVCLVLYLIQDRMLYLPPAVLEHPGARVLRLTCGDATLRIWQLHPEARDALIYFGGNGERVGANLPDFDAAFADRAVYLVNYRGYDGSTGRPSETALISDAQRIYDWVSTRHPHIAIIGRSLGSGVAAAVGASRHVERLVLVTPYDSIANVAAEGLPWVPVRWLLRDHYDSVPRIGKVTAPVLIVVAEDDEVISRRRSDALIAATPPAIRHTVLIPGASHNDIGLFPAYLRALKEFLSAPLTAVPD
jgi:fermentation-respiration switch protein FrsA (DUF1100 family)